MTSDIINGIFELVGSLVVWYNGWIVIKDQGYAGVRPHYLAFFAGWGGWNLYYYPHLAQWWSFWGGISLVAANLFWMGTMVKYGRK